MKKANTRRLLAIILALSMVISLSSYTTVPEDGYGFNAWTDGRLYLAHEDGSVVITVVGRTWDPQGRINVEYVDRSFELRFTQTDILCDSNGAYTPNASVETTQLEPQDGGTPAKYQFVITIPEDYFKAVFTLTFTSFDNIKVTSEDIDSEWSLPAAPASTDFDNGGNQDQSTPDGDPESYYVISADLKDPFAFTIYINQFSAEGCDHVEGNIALGNTTNLKSNYKIWYGTSYIDGLSENTSFAFDVTPKAAAGRDINERCAVFVPSENGWIYFDRTNENSNWMLYIGNSTVNMGTHLMEATATDEVDIAGTISKVLSETVKDYSDYLYDLGTNPPDNTIVLDEILSKAFKAPGDYYKDENNAIDGYGNANIGKKMAEDILADKSEYSVYVLNVDNLTNQPKDGNLLDYIITAFACAGKTVVINYTGTGDITLPYMNANGSYGERDDAYAEWAANIIWNCGNATGTVEVSNMQWGTILAPKATVHNQSNIIGTVIADKLWQGGEVHDVRWGGIPEDEDEGEEPENPETPKVGNLTVEKVVEGGGDEASNKEFTFTITGPDAVKGNTYGDVAFDENGKAEITITGSNSKTIEKLPAGTYTVSEKDAKIEGYTLTVTITDEGKVEVIDGKEAKVTVTNTYTKEEEDEGDEPEVGNLSVTKTVSGNAGETDRIFHFVVTIGEETFTIELKHGDTWTSENFPVGTEYTVVEVEANQDDYTTTSENASGAIKANETIEVSFNNEKNDDPDGNDLPESVEVTVTKKWEDNDSADRPTSVTVQLYRDGEAYGETVTLNEANNWAHTWMELEGGHEYTVEEINVPDGYTASVSKDASGWVITNTKDDEPDEPETPEDPTPDPEPETIDVSVSKVWDDGESEDRPESVTVQLYRDGEVYETVTLSAENGWAYTWTGLEKDHDWTVGEINVPEGYEQSVENENGVWTITNTKDDEGDEPEEPETPEEPEPEVGSLTVSKTVAGNAGDMSREFHFTVTLSDTSINGTYGDMTFVDGVATFALRNGKSKTATDLPAGITYTVTETEADQDGYVTTSTGSAGEIAADGNAAADFTNTRDIDMDPGYGNLTVSKIVGGIDGDRTQEFTFIVTLSDTSINGTYGDMTFNSGVATFTLRHGQSVTAHGLPEGITYSVMEVDAHMDGYFTASSGRDGTIQENGTAQAIFFNTRGDAHPDDPELEEFDDDPVPLAGWPDEPKTGDESKLGMWIAMMTLSMAGFGLVIGLEVMDRKRKHSK